MIKKITLLIGLLCFTLIGNAEVGNQTCRMLGDKNQPFILVLQPGDDFVDVVNKCVAAADIENVIVSGLGSLKNTELGFFDATKNHYQNKTFSGDLEIVTLTGNIKRSADGGLQTHLHVVLANNKYEVIGGHLQSATVAAGAEVNIIPAQKQVIQHYTVDEQPSAD